MGTTVSHIAGIPASPQKSTLSDCGLKPPKGLLLEFMPPTMSATFHLPEGIALNWKQLLSTKRVKGLFGQTSSTPIAGDLRSEFDRDYGRTVFSTPVRRLQDKAQVFPLERHDAVRTRLTHSMEVSSVARSFGDSAERFLFKSGVLTDENQKGVLGTIAATCGLVHDLGNPPFGHGRRTGAVP